MKNLSKIIFLMFLVAAVPLFGQAWYDGQWKKIEQNYAKGQYKSNLPIVLEIQNQAMKENNTIQLIRSLKAEFELVNNTEDDTKNDTASRYFKKLSSLESTLSGESKLVYRVLLGKFISDYYERDSWEIRGRTNINSQDMAQIETWSRLDFKNFLSAHFSSLEKDKLQLKKIQISRYKDIFDRTDDLDFFPTLFEWNAVQHIEFLTNGDFFTKNELAAHKPVVLKIYDELTASNSGNSKLYFQHQKLNYELSFTSGKDRKEQLQNLLQNSTEGDYKVLIADDLAEQHVAEENYAEALKWIAFAEKQYPKSRFLNQVINRKNQIVNPALTIKYEIHTQPNKPIHLVAEHKNMSGFSLNIYEVKQDFEGFLKYAADSYRKENFVNLGKSLVRKEQFTIQNLKDYKLHQTSLEIKPLPNGLYVAEYVVEGKIEQNFHFIVTGSRIIFQKKNSRSEAADVMKLVSRENGASVIAQPLNFYENADRTKITQLIGAADGTGNFTLPKSANSRYYRTYLVQQPSTGDFNLLQSYGGDYSYEPRVINTQQKVQIFLDRAIYRPGQTVYFKVINTQLNQDKESVVKGLQQKITLEDANYDEISAQSFVTSEYGSYSGSFTLPQGKLNGTFTLNVEGGPAEGYKSFQVEEYKRPKFEVTFEPVKEEYKYGQILEIKGKAMMFSGVPLSNATVNYEIKKKNIRWMYFWWYPQQDDNENSILGDVKTNDKGEFVIKVDLKKDENLEGIQVDNYEINASVTDINGETQSASTQVKVSSVSHFIETEEVTDRFTDENITLKVKTKNYNDQELNKSYQVKLFKLEEPQRVIRNNFVTEVQDLPAFSKPEFIQKFPHDLYDKSELPENWKEIQTILSKTGKGDLNLGKIPAGNYKLQFFNIEGKDTIRTEHKFAIFNKKFLADTQMPFLKVLQDKPEYERNSKATVYIYSAVPDALVYIFKQNGNGETVTETHKLRNGVLAYSTDFPKNESIDALNLQIQLVAFNDVQTASVNLKIATDKKPLRIETVTFRDKLQPGSKEKWSIKILGEEKEKINAEVLASMYDMSLDQFSVNTYNWEKLYRKVSFINSYSLREGLASEHYSKRFNYLNTKIIQIPQFEWFGYFMNESRMVMRTAAMQSAKAESAAPPPPPGAARDANFAAEDSAVSAVSEVVVNGAGKKKEDLDKVPVRENLNETAFFYPSLYTDKDGNVSFEFTSPEALTQWKLMFLAHTKDARGAVLEKEVVTQKEFSVTPNYPRFLREGDELVLQTKLNSLLAQKMNGTASLQILDAFTNEDITSKFGISAQQNFSLAENGNSVVSWILKVPAGVSSVILKTVAKAGNFSDGEQKAIAILPNRMLVTDAVPIFVKEGQTKTFVLDALKNSTSTSVANISNTLELTTNPIWEVIFALPSLKEETNNSADAVFNKWFADVIAAEIFKANPKLKSVFQEYQNKGLLTSNLEKNQELKQLLLEETPWVLEAQSEEEQMAKIARLFDLNTMKNSIQTDWEELRKLQNPDGGFSWYSGYPSSYYTSLYILKNLGRINFWLKDNINEYQSAEQKEMVARLIRYVDNEINDYIDVKTENVWSNWALDYLDTRHYWETAFPLKGTGAKVKSAVIAKAKTAKLTDFTFFGLHRAALLFDAYGLKDVSGKLLTYLKETSTDTETQGVYWKKNLDDWGWYSSKTVNHAGALEAFNKLRPADINFVEEMKIWLVTQKEVHNWGSSRATAEVIYTILNTGKSWTTAASDNAVVVWGGKTVDNPDKQATGYLKTAVKSDKLDKNLATVKVSKPGPGIVQGGLFWQYYEDLDKIKSSETYISITKELYRKVKTVNGEELQKITANTPLKVGDKVTVRMILNTDRPLEFIHLKDMRAAGFEPVDVISGYEWKNNLAYYQSTKDASTNFYIEYMPKGKFVFEYDYIANAAGKFSNGITTLQNYYAPQMNAHTKGTKVEIVNY